MSSLTKFAVGDLVKYDGPAGIFLAEVTRSAVYPWVYVGEVVKVISHEKKISVEDRALVQSVGGDPDKRIQVGQPVTLHSDDPFEVSENGFGISTLVSPAGEWSSSDLPE